MKRKTSTIKAIVCSFTAAAALCMPNVSAERTDTAAAPETASEFLQRALQASQVELQAAKLAQENGQHQAIRQLGEKIAKDQQRILERLQKIAENRKVASSKQLEGEHQQQLQTLRTAASDFDQAFIRQMIADHKRDLAMLDQCSEKFSDDFEIARLIQDHRSTLKRHLEFAQKAARTIGFGTRETAQGAAATSEEGDQAAKDLPLRKGDGEILGLPTSNNDGTILGVIPAPSSKVEAGNQSESYTSEELTDGKVDKGVENVFQADQDTVVAPSPAERDKAGSKSVRDK